MSALDWYLKRCTPYYVAKNMYYVVRPTQDDRDDRQKEREYFLIGLYVLSLLLYLCYLLYFHRDWTWRTFGLNACLGPLANVVR